MSRRLESARTRRTRCRESSQTSCCRKNGNSEQRVRGDGEVSKRSRVKTITSDFIIMQEHNSDTEYYYYSTTSPTVLCQSFTGWDVWSSSQHKGLIGVTVVHLKYPGFTIEHHRRVPNYIYTGMLGMFGQFVTVHSSQFKVQTMRSGFCS